MNHGLDRCVGAGRVTSCSIHCLCAIDHEDVDLHEAFIKMNFRA